MKVGEAVAEILKREGIEILTGYPVNHLLEFAAAADIRPVIVRQERIGLHMADAISRLSSGRRLGAFCMQHGPGTENAYGGVAQAFGESVPILVLPMGYARRVAHVGPNYNATASMRSVSKSAEPITMASEVVNIMRRAFSRLRNGRGGPVVVEIPSDIWNDEVPEPLDYTPVHATRYGPDPEHVREAAQMLASAQRPVIYAGQGVHYARAWPQLRRLAELLAIPVMTTLGGKSSFPEDHPLSLGSGGVAFPKQVHTFLHNADLVFGIGNSFTETSFAIPFPKGKTIIHATLDPDHINKDERAAIGLVGDAGLVLDALLAELDKTEKSPRDATAITEEIANIREEWLGQWMPRLTSNETPLTPYRVIWDLCTRWTGRTRSSPMMPAARATSSRRSGWRPSRSPISAGARRRSSATGSASPWAPSFRIRRSSASMSGVMPRSASPEWISRPRCASASRSCRCCSTISRWRSSSR